MSLSSKLKKLRQEKGYYQKDVSEIVCVKRNTISGYENGERTPSLEVLKKLANVYGVDTDYLLSEDKDVKKVSQNSFSNEKKAMLEAYDKLSPKMQKKILAMINAFVEEK